MKTLYLVRHAKSSWKDATLDDWHRPLNQRGSRDALDMGCRLKHQDTQIDLIISSPALRALTTATLLARQTGYDSAQIQLSDRLYFASPDAMVDLLHQTHRGIETLMLVGHNPDMSVLLQQLCPQHDIEMPTCAIATLQIDADWPQLEAAVVDLADYDFPKKPDGQ